MLQPTPIMEGALLRKLRGRSDLRRMGVEITPDANGGLRVMQGATLIGVWRWTGETFVFATSRGNDEFAAPTILGALTYTSTLVR